MSKHIPTEDLSDIANIYSPMGMEQLVAAKLGNFTSGPAVKKSRTLGPEDDQGIQSSKKPGTDFSQTNDSDKDDSVSTMLLLAMFDHKADQDGNVSGANVDDFLTMLDKFGVSTQPLKNIIEQATGKPYAEFIGDKNSYVSGNDISYALLGGHRGSRETGPLISNGRFNSALAIRTALTDDAGKGNCAKGAANIAEAMGLDIRRGNATTWSNSLRQLGWKQLEVDPAHAPVGSFLVFNSDRDSGKATYNNGHGRQYGHVEVVAETTDHRKVFVSDAVRNNYGGSVPDNRATVWMAPGLMGQNMTMALNNGGSHSAPRTPQPA